MLWFSSSDRDELVAAVRNELDQDSEIANYWIVQDASGVEETVILFAESVEGFTPNIIVSWYANEAVRHVATAALPPITVCEYEEVVDDSERSWTLNIFLAGQDYYVEESLSVGDSKGIRNIRFNSNARGRPQMRKMVDIFAVQALPKKGDRS